MTIHWKAVEQYFTVVLFVILENLLILDLALSGNLNCGHSPAGQPASVIVLKWLFSPLIYTIDV